MKTIFTLFLSLMWLISCTSLQKMMDSGDYDSAFKYSASKLRGSKYKETKYVQAFERAYSELQLRSTQKINSWKNNPSISNYTFIIREYKTLQNRQNIVLPLMPLVSKEGYEASFEIRSYDSDINNSELAICGLYYDEAKYLYENGLRHENKASIRDAYAALEKILLYRSNYRDVRQLMVQYHEKGVVKVALDVKNNIAYGYGDWITQDVISMPISRLNSKWYVYDVKSNTGAQTDADYVMVVDINSLNFSPEREFIKELVETKSIPEESKKKEKSERHEDERVHLKTVTAHFIETFREKNAQLAGSLRIYDTHSHQVIHTVPIQIDHNFNGYASAFKGDDRALSQQNKGKLDSYLETFPTNDEMVSALSKNFGDVLLQKMRSSQI